MASSTVRESALLRVAAKAAETVGRFCMHPQVCMYGPLLGCHPLPLPAWLLPRNMHMHLGNGLLWKMPQLSV